MRKMYLGKKMAAAVLTAGLILSGAAGTKAYADETAQEEFAEEAAQEEFADEEAQEESAELLIEDAEPVEEAVQGDTTWQNSFDGGDYILDENAKTIQIQIYTGTATEVTIPATAVINGVSYHTVIGARDSSISRSLFASTKTTSVKIEAGVTLPANCYRLFARGKGDKQTVKLATIDMRGVDTSHVTNMASMFYGCTKLTSLLTDSSFSTANVTNMDSMFENCSVLQSFPVASFNTAKVTSMANMFAGCTMAPAINVGNWNTGAVTNMSGMFANCSALASLDVSDWNTGNVTDMNQMFFKCMNLFNLNVAGWNTANVKDMSKMFSYCPAAKNDMKSWNVEKLENASEMFASCISFETKDLSGWKTSNLKNVKDMFLNCSIMKTLNMKAFDLTKLTDASALSMFSGCTALETIIAPKKTATIGNIPLPDSFTNPAVTIRVYSVPTAVSYTFTNLPGGSMTLMKGDSGKIWPFSDYAPNVENWKYTGIVYCNENGIIMGDKTNGEYVIPRKFRPDDNISRRDFAVILYRLQNSPDVTGLTEPFDDVPAGQYYTDAVIWAYNEGIVKGKSENLFGPKDNITRVQIAIMLQRYNDKYGRKAVTPALLDGFSDAASLKEEYAHALSWAVGMGVIGGLETKKDGEVVSVRLGAKEKATRAQCAKMIMSFLEY